MRSRGRTAGHIAFSSSGGDTPISLDADATVSEVPDDFIVNEVIAQALVRFGDEKDAQRAVFFAEKAAVARAAFPGTRYQRQVV